MSKLRETSTDPDGQGMTDPYDIDIAKKPNWVNLAQLDTPVDETLVNNLLYKPALRFHGLNSRLWGLGISRTPSLVSDVRPPSYKFSESINSKHNLDACSSCDQGSLYRKKSLTAVSPVTLRRRNTIAVILVAVALLAAVATITGIILHLMHPKEILRANVRFTIANENFTDTLYNTSSEEFKTISRRLCSEMDMYYLTSELSDFYLGCKLISLRNDTEKPGLAVHYTIDFKENPTTNEKDRIKNVILRKSGRLASDANLYFVIRDYLVYLKSLRVTLEKVPTYTPDYSRPIIPWRDDVDFIARIPVSTEFDGIGDIKDILKGIINSLFNMTAKIDKMQGAIDFINNTLHEDNRPIFRLENTLQNMSASLDNLKLNLNSINETLNGFKWFLQQFDNTIFDVRDVIKYLDETFRNLDKTVQFVGSSLNELNDTVNLVDDVYIKGDTSLEHLNNSAVGVKKTTNFANRTLDSMTNTLNSLENAVVGLYLKVDEVFDGMDDINVSLRSINKTVQNSYSKMNQLRRKMNTMNSSVDSIEQTVARLNETYNHINEVLSQLNESFVLINGTTLDVIRQLIYTDDRLSNISNNMDRMRNGMMSMNTSLRDTLDWMGQMVKTLDKFTSSLERRNDSIILNLQNAELIETLSTLLGMNNTLFEFGNNVDQINKKLNNMESTLFGLESNLYQLKDTLANVNVTFKRLNNTLETTNTTIKYISKALGHINQSIDAMNKSSNDLTSIFRSIDKTLDMVNSTITKVNETGNAANLSASDVNITLLKTGQRINNIMALAINVSDLIGNSSGSLPDLNKHLYNANESLRVIHGKTEIVSESYDMLVDTLAGIEKTIHNLLSTIDDTGRSMERVNTSFANADSSLESMKDTERDWNERLTLLTASFEGMNDSMKDIGTAFPNLMKNLNALHQSITQLQSQIKDQSDQLNIQSARKDKSYDRYILLKSNTDGVANNLRDTQRFLQDIRNVSTKIGLDISALRKVNGVVNSLYENMDMNVKLLNNTLSPLQTRFDKIHNESNLRQKSLQEVVEMFPTNIDELKTLENTTKEYKNIKVPFREIENDMKSAIDVINHIKDSINADVHRLNNESTLVWNENGHPVGADIPFSELHERIQSLNITMDRFDDLLSNATNTTIKMNNLHKHIQSVFANITSTMKKVDVINDKGVTTNKTIQELEQMVENKLNDTDMMAKKVDSLIDLLEITKLEYGNINGTYNNSNGEYMELERLLRNAHYEILAIENELNETRNVYSMIVTNYTTTMDRYKEDRFGMDGTSQDRIQDYISDLEKGEHNFNKTALVLKKISTASDKAAEFVKKIETMFESLKTELSDKTKSHNFVKKQKPLVLTRFNKSDIRFIEVNETFDGLQQRITELLTTADNIEARSKLIPNIKIVLEPEYKTLSDAQDMIVYLNKNMTTMKKHKDDVKTQFDNIEKGNLTFDDLKKEYASLQKVIDGLNENVEMLATEGDHIDNNLHVISKELDTVEVLLDKYNTSRLLANGLYNDITELKEKTFRTDDLLSKGVTTFNELELTLAALQHNYTNFTATNVNLSESFILETIEETRNMFHNLTFEIELSKELSNVLSENASLLLTTLDRTSFNRTNTNAILDTVVSKHMNYMRSSAERLNSSLDDIDAKVQLLNITLHGVNETLHTTNQQLFFDRQKKLLADSKFPGLEKEHTRLNNTIDAISKYLLKISGNVTNITIDYHELDDRLDKYSNLNISTADLNSTLANLTKFITNGYSKISITIEDLNKISSVLWTPNGHRYTENETISDMKHRYKQAADAMNTIDNLIETLKDKLNKSMVDASQVHEEVLLLNKTLDEHDLLDSKWIKINGDFVAVTNRSDIAKLGSGRLRNRLDAINDQFTNLSERFSHVNKTAFDDLTDPFEKNLVQNNESYRTVSKHIDTINTKLEQLKNVLRDVKKIRSATLTDKKGLTDTNAYKDTLFANASNLFQDIKETLNSLSNDTEVLSERVITLDDELIGVKEGLERQEKQELYEEYSPLHRYMQVNATLETVLKQKNNTEREVNKVVEYYAYINDMIDSIPNVDISTEDIRSVIKTINETIARDETILEGITAKHLSIKTLLTAPNGLPFAENETIEEMKKRYRDINNKLDDIENNTRTISRELDAIVHDELPNQNKFLDEFGELLDKYKQTEEELDRLQMSMDELGNNITDHNVLNVKRESEFNDKIATLDELKLRYENISSPVIANIYETLKIDIQENERLLSNLTHATNDIFRIYEKTNATININKMMFNSNFTSFDQLNDFLTNFTKINSTVSLEIESISEELLDIQREGELFDRQLNEQEHTINHLRNLLERGQKEKHIAEVTSRMRELYDSVLQYVHNSSGYVETVTRNIDGTTEDILIVQNILNNMPILNITLQDVQDDTDMGSKSLKEINNTIKDANNILGEFTNSFESMNTTGYILNNTFKEIETHSLNLLSLLNDVKMNLSSVFSNITKIRDANKHTQDLLQEFRNQTYTNEILTGIVEQINRDHNSTKQSNQNFQMLQNDVERFQHQIYSNISSIKDMYRGVDKAELWKRFNELNDSHTIDGSEVDNLDILQTHVQGFLNESKIIIDEMILEIGSPVNSLRQLQRRNEIIRSLIEDSKSPTTAANSSLESQLALQDTLHDNMTKTNTLLNGLQNDFKQQQIIDYIKTHFPTVIDKYTFVNETVSETGDSMRKTNDKIKDLYYKLSDVNSLINTHPVIDTSLLDRKNEYESVANDFQDVLVQKDNIVQEFKNLSEAISQRIGQNDSLDTIEKRFSDYNETLNNILKRVIQLNSNVDVINSKASEQFQALLYIGEEVVRFDEIVNDTLRVRNAMNQVGFNLSEKENKYLSQNKLIEDLDETINSLKVRFSKINDSTLNRVANELLDKVRNASSLMDRDISEFNDTKMMFNRDNISINDIGVTLNTSLPEFSTLTKTLDEIQSNLSAIEININTTKTRDLPFFSEKLNNRTHLINGIDSEIKDLRDRFLQTEKQSYLDRNLPGLLDLYKALHNNLTDVTKVVESTTRMIVKSNITLTALALNISHDLNIDFNTTDLYVELDNVYHETDDNNDILQEQRKLFNAVDGGVFTDMYWDRHTIDKIKKRLTALEIQLSDIQGNVSETHHSDGQIQSDVNELISTMSNMTSLMERYRAVMHLSDQHGYNLSSFAGVFGRTQNMLKNVTSSYNIQNTKRLQLMSAYKNITNGNIDRMVTAMEHILIDTVGLRLPMLNSLFKTRMIDWLKKLKDIQKSDTEQLNTTHTLTFKLEKLLNETEKSIAERSSQIVDMTSSNVNFNEEGSQMVDYLNESNYLLKELEKALKEEEKKIFLNEMLPKVVSTFDSVMSFIGNVSDESQTTQNTLNVNEILLQNITDRIDSSGNINVSTTSLKSRLQDTMYDLQNIKHNLTSSVKRLHNGSPKQYNKSELIRNTSISIDDLNTMFDKLLDEAIRIENVTLDAQEELRQINQDNIEYTLTLNDLHNSFDRYKMVREDLNVTKTKLDGANNYNTETSIVLDTAFRNISSLNASLQILQEQYQAFRIDNTSTVKSLLDADEKLNNLKRLYNNITSLLNETIRGFQEMESNVTSYINGNERLNKIITFVTQQIPLTESQIETVNKQLAEIESRMPLVHASINMFKEDVEQLNNTLINEEIKQGFSNKTMPKLLQKYKTINMTFDMTNKSLQIMQDNIDQLEDHIRNVKMNMDKFENINISMSDMESNVTHMEDRLMIMKEHYNNVHEVVVKLQLSLNEHDISGKNVSFNDAKLRYESFNETLDKIDGVLQKIDVEINEMDYHLIFINDTLVSFDNALTSFEDKGNKTKSMNMDIDTLRNSLNRTNTDIIEMSATFENLNESFVTMQKVYKDVIGTTAENNTQISKDMAGLQSELYAIKKESDGLYNDFILSSASFQTMNETLFQNITSFDNLNKTLSGVKEKYTNLSRSINELATKFQNTDNTSNVLNSSLEKLGHVLTRLNDTLYHEQVKFDFLASNFGGLQSKTQNVESFLKEAKKYITTVKDTVKDGNKTIDLLKARLDSHKNLNISLDTENQTIRTSFKNIDGIEMDHTDLHNAFTKVMSNLTSAKDRSGTMSDIKQKYTVLNQTLDTLDTEIKSMNQQLGATNNETLAVDSFSKDLLRSIEAFENTSSTATKNINEMEKLGVKLQESENILINSNESVTSLQKATRDMIDIYSYIDDLKLKENLTSLIEDIEKENKVLHQLKGKQIELNKRRVKAVTLSNSVQESLRSNIASKFELDSTVDNSTESLNQLSSVLANITNENIDLERKSLEAQNRINILENELQKLNDTFYDEKIKIDFVKQNYPGADMRYRILNKDIQKTDKEIKNVSLSLGIMNTTLNDISGAIDRFSVIDIPLDAEKQVAEGIKKDINDLKDMYKNITGRYAGLNVSTLQDRQRSYNELKGEYDSFDSKSNALHGDVKVLNDRLTLLNKKLHELDITMVDFNSTLGKFADTKTNATTLFNDINEATDLFTKTNQTVEQMEKTLNKLKDTINEILTNFTDVKDPILINAKDSLQKLLMETLKNVSLLKETTLNLNNLHDATSGNASQLNGTLLTKKISISNLKTDITDAWGKLGNITSLLNKIYDKQTIANKTSTELDPQIKSIVGKINDLYASFEKEQTKLDFIKDKKPALQLSFKKLNVPLEETNKRISNTELKLADLQFSIKTIGDRLNRFKPINITNQQEMAKWQNLSESVKQSSKDFIQLSKMYNALETDMKQLDDRNKSIADIQTHYTKINKTVDVITDGLLVINNQLKRVANVSKTIESDMESFDTIMNNFKTVRTGIKSTQTQSEEVAKNLVNTKNKSTDVNSDISTLQHNIEEMESKYKVLADKTWEALLPKLKSNISSFNKSMIAADRRSTTLNKSISDTIVKLTNAFTVLQNTGLTRKNAEVVIGQVNRTLSKTAPALKRIKGGSTDLNKTVEALLTKTTAKKSELEQLNRTLAVELQKLQLVNRTITDLRAKYKRVNSTFVANVPDVNSLQATLEGVVAVISRIKEKMLAFDMQDTDKSVHRWDQSIIALNNTVQNIINQNKETSKKLLKLKTQLWDSGPMYTKTESLSTVQSRLDGYNKTLDDILAAVHRIEVKLSGLENDSRELAMTLDSHDTMLTTTPEPLGPPHWLQFTSTEVGTIGKDRGMAECSVGDLLDWDVMKITRQRGNEKEKTVAAWKLGLGARKTIKDRRISVQKSENATGGSLTLNIRSLQCDDEAAYYCYIDTFSRYPLFTEIAVVTPPEDSLDPDFPTEVFEDKIANFSCTGHPGYPNGRLTWKVKHEADKDFQNFDFYSAKPQVTDTNCIRTETNRVEYQFNMSWNNTKIRCYIENTTYFGEGIIRLLPFDICNKVRFLGTISHPYTPHKYIVCGKELNIMQCPGDTCYDKRVENCVRCAAGQQSADPCHGKPLYSYVAHEKDCKKYYICMGPTKTVKRCTRGYFNPNMPGNCAIAYAQSYCAQRSG